MKRIIVFCFFITLCAVLLACNSKTAVTVKSNETADSVISTTKLETIEIVETPEVPEEVWIFDGARIKKYIVNKDTVYEKEIIDADYISFDDNSYTKFDYLNGGYKKHYWDSEGRIVRKEEYLKTGFLEEYTDYEYESKADVVSNTIVSRTETSCLVNKIIKYEYDENGNLIAEHDYDDNGHNVITYNSSGDIVSVQKSSTYSTPSSQTYSYNENGLLSKITYLNSYGETKGEDEFEYDSYGNLVKESEYSDSMSYLVNGAWTNYDVYDYKNSYDSQGQLIKKEVYRHGKYAHTELFEYDGNGNVIREESCLPNSEVYSYFEDQVIEYRYADNGTLIYRAVYNDGNLEAVEEFTNDGLPLKDIIYSTTYQSGFLYDYNHDNTGKVVNKTVTRDGKPYEQVEYKYDSNGNCIEEICVDKESGDIEFIKRVFEGKKLVSYSETEISNSYRIDYTYDKNNLLVSEKKYELTEDGAVFKEMRNYTYTTDGKTETVSYSNNNDYYRKNEYKYDEYGNKISDTETTPDGKYSNTYTYTNDGIQIYSDTDFVTNELGKTARITYKDANGFDSKQTDFYYDEQGNVIEKQFTNYKAPQANHTFKYEYDSNNNLTRKIKYDSNGDIVYDVEFSWCLGYASERKLYNELETESLYDVLG